MAGVNIDLQSLGEKAALIRKINVELKEEFDKLINEIKTTDSIWNSKTATTLRSNYKNADKNVLDFYKDLDAYADFLTKVAEEYGYVEKKIQKNADSFID